MLPRVHSPLFRRGSSEFSLGARIICLIVSIDSFDSFRASCSFARARLIHCSISRLCTRVHTMYELRRRNVEKAETLGKFPWPH
jgi:hypothetical protein